MKPLANSETRPNLIVQAINLLARGGSNASGKVTLTPNAASTTVTDRVISSDSLPQLTPSSANAAAEWANGTIYVSAVANGSFVITHANSATTGRTVHWHAVGG